MSKFLILVDYRDRFMISIPDLHRYGSMDVERIRSILCQAGHSVEVLKFSELDLTRCYAGYYVLYQTAEDIGLFYKSYIFDIVYHLELIGAVVLPPIKYLVAHHNKNFMELLRSDFHDDALKTIHSSLFGTGEEAIRRVKEFPVVVKAAGGAGSAQVRLARNEAELVKAVRELSGVFIVNNMTGAREFLIYVLGMKLPKPVRTTYRSHTFYRRKFIVQNFIPGLDGDFKVLFFGGKYYTLARRNRPNDFRASGSGNFAAVPEEQIPGLLDFCQRVTREIAFPIIGMDVGFDGSRYHLFEFQCVHIGPYTLQCSDHWHESAQGQWIKRNGTSNLEDEYSRATLEYVNEKETH